MEHNVERRPLQHRRARFVGHVPKKSVVLYHDFIYRAGSWDRERPFVAGVERHQGELAVWDGPFFVPMVCRGVWNMPTRAWRIPPAAPSRSRYGSGGDAAGDPRVGSRDLL